MTIGIIAAMETEVKIIRSALCDVSVVSCAGVDVYEGEYKGLRVALSVCGIGKVNAAIHTQAMIDKYNVDVIIHTGVAGGLSDRLKRLSLVLADRLTYHDFEDEFKASCLPYQSFFYTDKGLNERMLNAADEPMFVGTIVSGDRFVNDSALKQSIRQRYDAMCVEMEGASIAHTAYLNGIPLCVLRCISDMADDNADESFLEFEATAGEKAANVVLKALAGISDSKRRGLMGANCL